LPQAVKQLDQAVLVIQDHQGPLKVLVRFSLQQPVRNLDQSDHQLQVPDGVLTGNPCQYSHGSCSLSVAVTLFRPVEATAKNLGRALHLVPFRRAADLESLADPGKAAGIAASPGALQLALQGPG
jgi:hypothetical protein